jgi:type II secretory pathway pseudopilin PulG
MSSDMKNGTESSGQGGFTIIEVLMFLAISGALLALMIFAVYRMLDNSRFSDTINSATSFVQTQYEEARSGVRPDEAGICGSGVGNGRSSCLLLGKAIVFRDFKHDKAANSGAGLVSYMADSIESYYVISKSGYLLDTSKSSIDDLGNSGSDSELIAAEPQLTTAGRKSQSLLYSAHFAVSEDGNSYPSAGLLYRSKNSSSDEVDASDCTSLGCSVNVVLILRNPKNATLNTYAFYADLGDNESSAAADGTVATNINIEFENILNTQAKRDIARNASIAIPIVNGDSNSRSLGAICIEQGASSASVFGARELGYYDNVKNNKGVADIIKLLRGKCENM